MPYHPRAPCNSVPWRTWPGRVRPRPPAADPSSYAPPIAARRFPRCGNTGSSAPPAWWSAIPSNTRVRPWLTLSDRDPRLAVRVALIFGARTDQTVVAVLCQHVRGPTRHAADGEDGRVEIDGNAQRIVGGSGIEIDIRIELLDLLDGLFHALGEAVELLLAGALAQFLAEHAQVGGARIFGAVDAVAEARNLDLARQRAFDRIHGGIFVAQAEQPPDHVLVGASVQWAFKRADAGRHRRVDIGQRGGHHAGGESGSVQLVIGMQRHGHVESAFHDVV